MVKQRLDSLFSGSPFRLEGRAYTVQAIRGDKVWCRREDGAIVPLAGYLLANSGEPSFWKRWQLSRVLP